MVVGPVVKVLIVAQVLFQDSNIPDVSFLSQMRLKCESENIQLDKKQKVPKPL